MSQPDGLPADPQTQYAESAEPTSAPASRAASSDPLLDQLTVAESGTGGRGQLDRFLATNSVNEALELWLGRALVPHRDTTEQLALRLNRDVATIDELLNRQLNEILHHPRFQKLEASWRGLKYLHDVLVREYNPAGGGVKIKILDVGWDELEKDFESAWDVEQSSLFYKVYEQELGQAGGEPFGLLIGDYEIHPHGSRRDTDDLAVLGHISQVAASAFCPFITNASPEMFQLSEFGELEEVQDLGDAFVGENARRWKSLCQKEDARFIGLTMPRVLMRLPYGDRPDLPLARQLQRQGQSSADLNRFLFREDVRGPDTRKYLWGGAAYAFAGVALRSYCRTGWLTDIRGVQRNNDGGGLIVDLPVEYNATDSYGVSPKVSTDVIITDAVEKDLTDLGFIPLCSCYDTGYSAFYSAKSIQTPKQYDDSLANMNARVSSMIYTMLCASRFAHYLKVIGRDMVGQVADADDIERELQNWIAAFVTADAAASNSVKARYPLAGAKVQVKPLPGKQGAYRSVFHLQPHYEIEGLSAAIRLVTEL